MEHKRQIQFQYIFSDDYNPEYCNGAYGGVTSQGEIVVNFYLERMPIPKSLTHEINEDGSLSGAVDVSPENLDSKVIRYITSGVVLSESSARSIHDWLGQQIQEIEQRRAIQVNRELIGESYSEDN